MPYITPNLRLLFSYSSSSSSSALFPPRPSLSLLSKPALFSILSSSERHRPTSSTSSKRTSLTRHSRTKSSFPKKAPMEETSSSFGFNKRRAEGKDGVDKQKKNLQLKTRRLNPTNTISYVQILGTGMDTQDTSPSVLLFFDKQRFIFNAGEGLQRFCTEHKIKLSKIDHIFLSRVCSETAGGLPGLLLTLAGMGEEGVSVNIWGPSDFKYLVDAMKSFIPHAAMVHTHRFGPAPGSDVAALPDLTKLADPIVLVDNEVVKISAILLKPNDSERSAVKPGEMSVIYVCELPEIMGKFDPKKAAALGLRPGPKYRELQSGNSVKSDNLDTMVRPSDVMGPSVPGPVVLLVDCPTESHALQLFSAESLRIYYYVDDSRDVPECAKTVNCIIHLSPTSVTSTPDYLKWMKRFGTAQHIMAGHQMKNVEVPILKSSARIAARLNYLCPQLFPAPGFWSLQHLNNLTTNSSASQGPECISAENLLKFTLRPHAHLGLDRTNIPSLVAPSKVMDELFLEIPSIVDAAQDVSHLWHGPREKETASKQNNEIMIEEPWLDDNRFPSCLENVRRDDLEIVLLGTGSSQPSKYRNVSSIYINLFAKGSLLLDCGEGTLGQLKRRYGVEGADNAVRNLRCIWISHIHADHHAGVARVLALRRDLLKGVPHEPLLVVGPGQLKRFLDAYERLEDLDMLFLNCRFTTEASWKDFECNDESNKDSMSPGSPINNEDMNKNNVNHTESNLFTKGSRMQSFWNKPIDNSTAFPLLKSMKKVLSESGLDTLVSFPVVHCPQAFGIVLKAADRINNVGKVIPGWKIVYSGDTRPCTELIEVSRGATVLIHEATFEDDMMEEAVARNHSTTKEAIEVGSSAGAYRIILTHFSQRYPKIPVFDSKHMHKACIAFDMMSVNLADLPVIPKALPYLKLLFKDDIPVDELDDVVDAVGVV